MPYSLRFRFSIIPKPMIANPKNRNKRIKNTLEYEMATPTRQNINTTKIAKISAV